MILRRVFFSWTLALLPVMVSAHAHLLQSTPAAGSSGLAPAQIMLEFNEATRLTALAVEKDGTTGIRKITLPSAPPDKVIHVAAPTLEPGAYTLRWRGVGDDGHVMSGTVRFTVTAK